MAQKLLLVLESNKPLSIHRSFDDLQKYLGKTNVMYDRNKGEFINLSPNQWTYDGLENWRLILVEFDRVIDV